MYCFYMPVQWVMTCLQWAAGEKICLQCATSPAGCAICHADAAEQLEASRNGPRGLLLVRLPCRRAFIPPDRLLYRHVAASSSPLAFTSSGSPCRAVVDNLF